MALVLINTVIAGRVLREVYSFLRRLFRLISCGGGGFYSLSISLSPHEWYVRSDSPSSDRCDEEQIISLDSFWLKVLSQTEFIYLFLYSNSHKRSSGSYTSDGSGNYSPVVWSAMLRQRHCLPGGSRDHIR